MLHQAVTLPFTSFVSFSSFLFSLFINFLTRYQHKHKHKHALYPIFFSRLLLAFVLVICYHLLLISRSTIFPHSNWLVIYCSFTLVIFVLLVDTFMFFHSTNWFWFFSLRFAFLVSRCLSIFFLSLPFYGDAFFISNIIYRFINTFDYTCCYTTSSEKL